MRHTDSTVKVLKKDRGETETATEDQNAEVVKASQAGNMRVKETATRQRSDQSAEVVKVVSGALVIATVVLDHGQLQRQQQQQTAEREREREEGRRRRRGQTRMRKW
jgi:hypothetical protein